MENSSDDSVSLRASSHAASSHQRHQYQHPPHPPQQPQSQPLPPQPPPQLQQLPPYSARYLPPIHFGPDDSHDPYRPPQHPQQLQQPQHTPPTAPFPSYESRHWPPPPPPPPPRPYMASQPPGPRPAPSGRPGPPRTPGSPTMSGASSLGAYPGSPSYPAGHGYGHGYPQHNPYDDSHGSAGGSPTSAGRISSAGISGSSSRPVPLSAILHDPPSHLPGMRAPDALEPLPPYDHRNRLPEPLHPSPTSTRSFMQSMPSYGTGPAVPSPYATPEQQAAVHGYRLPALGLNSITRHKKEIKRRTKTGCMTCRLRRIKCDETRPTCNNCKKSKRNCAGYDPSLPPPPPAAGPSSSLLSPTSLASPKSSLFSPGSLPRKSSSTAPAPLHISPVAAAAKAAAAAATASTASTLAAVRSPSALAAPHTTTASASSSSSSPARPCMPSIYTTTTPSTLSSPSRASLSAATIAEYPAAYTDWGASGMVYKAMIKVDEIAALAEPSPVLLATQPSREMLDDIVTLYFDIYVPGLQSFFETTWFNFQAHGSTTISTLLNNASLVGLLATFLHYSRADASHDPHDMAVASAMEPRIVWALASMAYSTPSTLKLPSDEPVAPDDATEARNRVAVIDALLSGGCVRTNPCVPPRSTGNPEIHRQQQFWWWLAEYLRLQDEADLANTPGNNLPRMREHALRQMRSFLDNLENRDVIYSIAILRDLAPRYPTASDVVVPPGHEDESDPRIKLAMATEFVRRESQNPGGMTNVVRRFAELGLRAFIQPGHNVRR